MNSHTDTDLSFFFPGWPSQRLRPVRSKKKKSERVKISQVHVPSALCLLCSFLSVLPYLGLTPRFGARKPVSSWYRNKHNWECKATSDTKSNEKLNKQTQSQEGNKRSISSEARREEKISSAGLSCRQSNPQHGSLCGMR